MTRLVLSCFVLLAVSACTHGDRPPRGMHSIEEARRAADLFFIEGSPRLFLQSIDESGASDHQREAFLKFAKSGWPNAKLRQHHKWTRLVSPAELIEIKNEARKEWSEELKTAADKAHWNVTPEKFIVYYFESDSSHAYWTLGLYRREGLWFFAAQIQP